MADKDVVNALVWQKKFNNNPEYRNFHCDACRRPIHKAWYYLISNSQFKTFVYFCQSCNYKLINGKLSVSETKINLPDKSNYPEIVIRQLQKSHQKFKNSKVVYEHSSTGYKTFKCDRCHKNIWKAYHLWNKSNQLLSEYHFCIYCGYKLDLDKLAD